MGGDGCSWMEIVGTHLQSNQQLSERIDSFNNGFEFIRLVMKEYF